MHIFNRRTALSATAGGLLIATRTASAAPKAKILETRSISFNPHLYHGWPTVARRANGELLVVCSGGRELHVCPFGRVELMRSKDEGKTWSYPRVVVDGPIDDRDAGVVETPNGKSILITTFTSLAYEATLSRDLSKWPAERRERWNAVQRRLTPAMRKQELGSWVIRSTDGGKTWSQRARCPVNSPHGPIGLSDGSLLYAGKRLWENNAIGVAASNDDGQSWRWLAEIAPRDGDKREQYHELHAVETKSGKLIAHIRNHNPRDARETLQSISADGGKTWSSPQSIGVWGLPSHLLKLADGRLLMSYGYRRKPFGNQARISDDEGGSWSAPMLISQDGPGGDLGYPSTVPLSDGKLLTIWYEVRPGSPRAVLRQCVWELDA